MTSSVARAMTLLRILLDAGGEASLATLSRRSELPKSTVHRLLGVLEVQGVVVRSRGGYALGDLALRLGGWVDAGLHERLVQPIKPYLVELFERTRHRVDLAMLLGERVIYLDSIFGHAYETLSLNSDGRSVPAHRSAAGLALLAFDPDAQARMLDGQVGSETLTPGALAALARELAAVRHTGIAGPRPDTAPGTL
ncbi:helix-turn-helix domain-containing protein, partial [Frankia sp. AiPs1]|uniref:IclR family transcriptional regulator n=1 Tax=Frankia sp. AiPs1 TaxID=573493 RepID=UPI002043FED0